MNHSRQQSLDSELNYPQDDPSPNAPYGAANGSPSTHPMSFGARGLDGSVIRGRGTHRRGRGVATRGALQGVSGHSRGLSQADPPGMFDPPGYRPTTATWSEAARSTSPFDTNGRHTTPGSVHSVTYPQYPSSAADSESSRAGSPISTHSAIPFGGFHRAKSAESGQHMSTFAMTGHPQAFTGNHVAHSQQGPSDPHGKTPRLDHPNGVPSFASGGAVYPPQVGSHNFRLQAASMTIPSTANTVSSMRETDDHGALGLTTVPVDLSAAPDTIPSTISAPPGDPFPLIAPKGPSSTPTDFGCSATVPACQTPAGPITKDNIVPADDPAPSAVPASPGPSATTVQYSGATGATSDDDGSHTAIRRQKPAVGESELDDGPHNPAVELLAHLWSILELEDGVSLGERTDVFIGTMRDLVGQFATVMKVEPQAIWKEILHHPKVHVRGDRGWNMFQEWTSLRNELKESNLEADMAEPMSPIVTKTRAELGQEWTAMTTAQKEAKIALMKYEMEAMKKEKEVGMTVRERRLMFEGFVDELTALITRGADILGIECFAVASGHLPADGLRDTSFVLESTLAANFARDRLRLSLVNVQEYFATYVKNNFCESELVKLKAVEHLIPADRLEKEWPPRLSKPDEKHPLVKLEATSTAAPIVEEWDAVEDAEGDGDDYARHCMLYWQRLFPGQSGGAKNAEAVSSKLRSKSGMVAWVRWPVALKDYGFIIVDWPDDARAPSNDTGMRFSALTPPEKKALDRAFHGLNPLYFRKRQAEDDPNFLIFGQSGDGLVDLDGNCVKTPPGITKATTAKRRTVKTSTVSSPGSPSPDIPTDDKEELLAGDDGYVPGDRKLPKPVDGPRGKGAKEKKKPTTASKKTKKAGQPKAGTKKRDAGSNDDGEVEYIETKTGSKRASPNPPTGEARANKKARVKAEPGVESASTPLAVPARARTRATAAAAEPVDPLTTKNTTVSNVPPPAALHTAVSTADGQPLPSSTPPRASPAVPEVNVPEVNVQNATPIPPPQFNFGSYSSYIPPHQHGPPMPASGQRYTQPSGIDPSFLNVPYNTPPAFMAPQGQLQGQGMVTGGGQHYPYPSPEDDDRRYTYSLATGTFIRNDIHGEDQRRQLTDEQRYRFEEGLGYIPYGYAMNEAGEMVELTHYA